jgi:hypothetical protein
MAARIIAIVIVIIKYIVIKYIVGIKLRTEIPFIAERVIAFLLPAVTLPMPVIGAPPSPSTDAVAIDVLPVEESSSPFSRTIEMVCMLKTLQPTGSLSSVLTSFPLSIPFSSPGKELSHCLIFTLASAFINRRKVGRRS